MSKEKSEQKSEQRLAEEWVQRLTNALNMLYPLDRQAVQRFLRGQLQMIKVDLKLNAPPDETQ